MVGRQLLRQHLSALLTGTARRLTVWLIFMTLTLSLPHPASANDRPFIGAGTWRPMPGQHPHVRMVQEDVHLDVHDKTYDVVANFEFHNDGPAMSVRMGFPEWGYDFPAEPSAFRNFRSTVDGVAAPTQRVVKTDNDEMYHAWWVKTVPFRAGQTRHVSVRFTAPRCETPGNQPYVEYDFTGGNWKGLVARSVLSITLPYDHWAIPFDIPRGNYSVRDGDPNFSRHGRHVTYVRSNWKANETLELVYVKMPASDSDFHLPHSDKDLAGKSARQLTLLRNEIAARHGRRFTDPTLKKYFESTSWYGVDPEYSDGLLDSEERDAMQRIQLYQDTHSLRW